ncbi:MAG: LytTR family transcriptional regulator DNA-binding domain-containing protein [Saprospiraceae bacterium]|nr:LytTR family transcriptional regulator DNA-binding domain-containing protein [Candidatus Defluviibacterium haderslevense]
MLNALDPEIVKTSSIIFITAYFNPEYIHQALKTSAVDYIQKPIDKDQLFKAIDKAIVKSHSTDLLSRITNLEHLVNNMANKDNKLPLFRVNGKIDYVALDEVIYFNSDDTITRFHLKTSEIIPSSKSLKYYTDYVEDLKQFFKISKQTVINLNHLLTFDKKTSTVHLDGPTTLEVSRRCSSELADRFKIKSEKS